MSSTNGDTRNESSKPLGHESAENNGPKPSGSLLSSPVTYEGAFATRSLQDDTIPALKDLETKTSEASDPGTTAPNFRANLQASLKDFHLFLWLTAVPEKAEDTKVESGKHSKSGLNVKNTLRADSVGRSFEVDISRLGTLFSDMEQFLCSANFKNRRAYKQCRSRTLQEVEARLAEFEGEEKQEKEEEEDRKGRGEGRDREYLSRDSHVKAREHKKFVRTAKEAFQFFLPLHYTSGVIEKYWGAVYYMIDVRTHTLEHSLKSIAKPRVVLERMVRGRFQPFAPRSHLCVPETNHEGNRLQPFSRKRAITVEHHPARRVWQGLASSRDVFCSQDSGAWP